MENGTLSAADVALLNRDGDGFANGWGGMIWLFAILALFGGGGFGFGNNGNTNALSADMQRGFDNQNTMAQTRDILSAVTNGTAQTIAASTQNATNAINAIKDGNASLIREFGNVETALSGLAGQMQQCCCETLRSIDGVNYNTTVQIQKVLDAISGNRMADMQNQINALQLQNAMSGVLRFPSAWTYAGGVFPPVSGTTTTP
jgi:hypothetical protein